MKPLLLLGAPRRPRPRDEHCPPGRGTAPRTAPAPPAAPRGRGRSARPAPPPAAAPAPPLTSPSICTCLTAESPVAAALPLPFEAPKPLPAAPEPSLRDAIFPLAPAGKRKTKHRKRRRSRGGAQGKGSGRKRDGREAGACAVPPRRCCGGGEMAAFPHGPERSPGGTERPSLGLGGRHSGSWRTWSRTNPVPCVRRLWPCQLTRPGTEEGPRRPSSHLPLHRPAGAWHTVSDSLGTSGCAFP